MEESARIASMRGVCASVVTVLSVNMSAMRSVDTMVLSVKKV